MKKFCIAANLIYIILVLPIIVTSCSKSQQETTATKTEIAVKESQQIKEISQEEKEVQKTILQHASVMQMKDLAKRDQARKSLYAQEYIYTGPDGLSFTKGELLARQKANRVKVKSVEVKNLKVRAYGQTAVANYQAKVVGSQKGLPYTSLNTSVTSVLVKKNGKWQIVTDHLTATFPS
jgi:ketosteroid isomerase-like protein